MENILTEQEIKKELLEISLGKEVTTEDIYKLILFSKNSIEKINIFIPASFKINEDSIISFFKYAYNMRDKQKKDGNDRIVSIIENRILQCFHEANPLLKYKLFDYKSFFLENQTLFEETLSQFSKDTVTRYPKRGLYMDRYLMFNIPDDLRKDIVDAGKAFQVRNIYNIQWLRKMVENKEKIDIFSFSFVFRHHVTYGMNSLLDSVVNKKPLNVVEEFMLDTSKYNEGLYRLLNPSEIIPLYILDNMDVFYDLFIDSCDECKQYHKYLLFEDDIFWNKNPELLVKAMKGFINDPNVDNSKFLYTIHPKVMLQVPDDLVKELDNSGKYFTINDAFEKNWVEIMKLEESLVNKQDNLSSFSLSENYFRLLKEHMLALLESKPLTKGSEESELFFSGEYKQKKDFVNMFYMDEIATIKVLENLPLFYSLIVNHKNEEFVKQVDSFFIQNYAELKYFMKNITFKSKSEVYNLMLSSKD